MSATNADEKPLTHVAVVDAQPQDAPTPSEKPTVTVLNTDALNAADELRRPSQVSTPSLRDGNPFETDVEAMISTRTTREDDSCGMKSTSRSKLNGSQVWPGQDHWKQKAKANRLNNRSCQCLAKLSKRNRILVRLGIILLVVLTAVGVGFGISKPLGAGIWRPAHS